VLACVGVYSYIPSPPKPPTPPTLSYTLTPPPHLRPLRLKRALLNTRRCLAQIVAAQCLELVGRPIKEALVPHKATSSTASRLAVLMHIVRQAKDEKIAEFIHTRDARMIQDCEGGDEAGPGVVREDLHLVLMAPVLDEVNGLDLIADEDAVAAKVGREV
jgi:hypothetical protein